MMRLVRWWLMMAAAASRVLFMCQTLCHVLSMFYLLQLSQHSDGKVLNTAVGKEARVFLEYPVCVKEKHIKKDPGIFSLLRGNFLHIIASWFSSIHG